MVEEFIHGCTSQLRGQVNSNVNSCVLKQANWIFMANLFYSLVGKTGHMYITITGQQFPKFANLVTLIICLYLE